MDKAQEDKTRARFAALLLGISALVIWLSSRMAWVSISAFDDKSGEHHENLVGASWSTEMTALALVLIAGCIAALVLRRWGRRIIGLVAALAAVGASWAPMHLLLTGGDPERARSILTSGANNARLTDPVSLSQWAQLTDMQLHPLWPGVALGGCALALFAGVLLMIRPGSDSASPDKYQRKQQREHTIQQELAENSDSDRVMWDALDADIDPTDADSRSC
ncbi:TIGR02234 family membrane protein [Corynebacterium poyangense]|uniref:TIGR02234 family membrane protein n=1 Tax=Corynebacterium poyangense TaxID=2684405 RepID=A0A7H0SPN5_9CORY|nr:TIGR02234 family membrane protein [Corynebacterium poyangense]MBZ8178097.1 TIGR02234 family membrane protein [Corynebacterium poyangense]QNQ90510.1 TIGR02234 family membrane protein [Corynebacterium poyangense]